MTPNKEELASFLREHRKLARFLVDESLGIEVARQIKELGWNVKYVDEVGLQGHSDEDVYAYAYRKRRVILTHDDDFMDNRMFPLASCAGVVLIPGASGDEDALVKAVGHVLSMFGKLGDFFTYSKISINPDGVWTVFTFDRASGKIEKRIYKFRKHGNVMEWVGSQS